MAKNKYTKVGAVLDGQYGPFLILGDTKGKEEYQYDVKVQRKNKKGEAVMVTNPMLSLFDPRKTPLKEGQKPRNVPDKLLFEVFIVEKTEGDDLNQKENMDILLAKEASALSDRNRGANRLDIEIEVRACSLLIKAEAEKGEKYALFPGSLLSETIDVLRRHGYSVAPSDKITGYLISWH